MSQNKKWFALIASILILTFLLAACSPTNTSTEEPAQAEEGTTLEEEQTNNEETAPEDTGADELVTIRIGAAGGLGTHNPLSTWSGWEQRLILYDGLFKSTGYDISPLAAESWEVSEDGMVWTIRIKEGITFHDGTPFLAEDIAWWINLVKDNQLGVLYEANLENIAELKAIDDYTLELTSKAPMSEGTLRYTLITWILPRSVWGEMTPEEMYAFEDPTAAIGNGPYRLVEFVDGEYEIYEAFENPIWGKPNIDRIIITTYTSTDAMIAALLAGEIDMITELPFTAVPRLLQQENIETAILDTTLVGNLYVNSYAEGTQPESLNDPVVREAIEMAIDKQKICDVAYLGYADPLHAVLPPTMGEWANSDLTIAFNLEAANNLLEEAGYVDSDNDGVREDLEGNPMRYRLATLPETTRVRIGEVIEEGLRGIGIEPITSALDWDGMFAALGAFDYDLILLSFNWTPEPNMPLGTFTCNQIGGWNYAGYCNAEFDELYQLQSQTLDETERKEMVWELQEMIFQDKPYIMLINNKRVDAYNSDRFTNFGTNSGYLLWEPAFMQGEPVK